MTGWLPSDPDIDRLLDEARADKPPAWFKQWLNDQPEAAHDAVLNGVNPYSELIRNGDVMAHHLADTADSAFYERMRVPSLIARREPTPEALLPAWLRRPVNGIEDPR